MNQYSATEKNTSAPKEVRSEKDLAADLVTSAAVRALLYEVSATPKPGLVDRNNSGSHSDMDFFTFLDSSASLIPWFREFFCLGWDYYEESEQSIFCRLKNAGQNAEAAMFSATGGINTHKGLIFAMAILCGALGRLHAGKEPIPALNLIRTCKALGMCSLKDFHFLQEKRDIQTASDGIFQGTKKTTNGEQIFLTHGITGARGEAAAGFPSVVTIGLPALKEWLAKGFSLNDAAVMALLTLISEVDDTNMVHRGGKELAEKRKQEAQSLLSKISLENFNETLRLLDQTYISEHLSPGGSADLLAISLFFYFLETGGFLIRTPV